jgi:hypothetical protein
MDSLFRLFFLFPGNFEQKQVWRKWWGLIAKSEEKHAFSCQPPLTGSLEDSLDKIIREMAEKE